MKKILKQLYYYIVCMRPKQWIKNSIIFIPLIFSGDVSQIWLLFKVVLVSFVFSIFVGATYVLNDMKDINKDKLHPKKKYRPLAAGHLSPVFAASVSCLLIIGMLILWWHLFGLVVIWFFLLYLVNTVIYTFYLKRQVIIDVFSIALGFVIRWLIGIYVIWVVLSPWLLIMLFFGALFLGFLKRYQEVMLWTNTRHNISLYNAEFLKQIIGTLTTVILMSYTLYTFNSVQSQLMLITLPFVSFGIVRYYYNIFYLKKYEESIEDIILKDKRIVFDILLCVLLVIFLISV